MDKRFRTSGNDKFSKILQKARVNLKFEEPGENSAHDDHKRRSQDHAIGILNGFLALFSNPLLH